MQTETISVFNQWNKFPWVYRKMCPKQNQYEIQILTKCEAYINIANQLVLQFAFHTYLIKTWYIAISIGKAKCTLCTKLKSFQLFKHFCIANNLHNAWTGDIDAVSTSLAGFTCECEFWSHRPWAEHVPPLLLMSDATRPGAGQQSCGWVWQCWRKVMGRFEEHQHFTTSSPTALGRNGCYGAPRMRMGAATQTGSWLCRQMSS